MKMSKISKAILVSAATLSSGLLFSGAAAIAQDQPIQNSGDSNNAQTDIHMDFEQYRAVVASLREKLEQDPGFRSRYLSNPTEVLTEAGLPANLQLEMMREDGLAYGPAFKTLNCVCTATCLVTN